MNDKISIVGLHTFTIRDAKTGKIKSQKTVKNIIVTAGRTVLARRLAGDTTFTGEITHGALGSGTTAPANSQTDLVAEITRVPTTSQTYVDNVAYLSFFFPAGSLVAYEEFGNFIDGTSSPDTGEMFTRVLMSGSKAATETLTIDTTYTIT
jgi:hypothetical protein